MEREGDLQIKLESTDGINEAVKADTILQWDDSHGDDIDGSKSCYFATPCFTEVKSDCSQMGKQTHANIYLDREVKIEKAEDTDYVEIENDVDEERISKMTNDSSIKEDLTSQERHIQGHWR